MTECERCNGLLDKVARMEQLITSQRLQLESLLKKEKRDCWQEVNSKCQQIL